jgi:hypothetical protein
MSIQRFPPEFKEEAVRQPQLRECRANRHRMNPAFMEHLQNQVDDRRPELLDHFSFNRAGDLTLSWAAWIGTGLVTKASNQDIRQAKHSPSAVIAAPQG